MNLGRYTGSITSHLFISSSRCGGGSEQGKAIAATLEAAGNRRATHRQSAVDSQGQQRSGRRNTRQAIQRRSWGNPTTEKKFCNAENTSRQTSAMQTLFVRQHEPPTNQKNDNHHHHHRQRIRSSKQQRNLCGIRRHAGNCARHQGQGRRSKPDRSRLGEARILARMVSPRGGVQSPASFCEMNREL